MFSIELHKLVTAEKDFFGLRASFHFLLFAAMLMCSRSDKASATLVGIVFDATGASPTNWTSVSVSTVRLNLIDESGMPTNIDASFVVSNFVFFQNVNAATKPIHTPDLAGVNNLNAIVTSIGFSDLVPNALYRLWIFALISPASGPSQFNALVTGGGAPFTFSFNPTVSGNLMINGVTSSSAQPLENYGNAIFSSSAGTIGINFAATSGNPGIAGIAIEPLFAAVPEARAWLMLGVVAIGAIGIKAMRARWAKP